MNCRGYGGGRSFPNPNRQLGSTARLQAEIQASRARYPSPYKIGSAQIPRTPLENAYICDAIRTPFGRYGSALASIRTDDLAAIPLRALIERNAKVDWSAVDDVVFGCANQAGEDNRNVA